MKRSLPTSCGSWIFPRLQGGSSDLRFTDDCRTLHCCSAVRRGAKNAAEPLSRLLAKSNQKDMCLQAYLSTLSEYLRDQLQFQASSEAHAHSRSSERMRVWQQREWSTLRFSTAADWKRERPQRLGGHTQVERILCIHHADPGLIIAALKTRVQRDLMTLPDGEC